MAWSTVLFYAFSVVILVSAIVGLSFRWGTRASVAWFQLSMGSLAGVFVLLGAHVIAIAQLFFCAGIALICFFAIDDSTDDQQKIAEASSVDDESGETQGRAIGGGAFGSWHWLVVTLGIAGAISMWAMLFGLVPGDLSGSQLHSAKFGPQAFESVGYTLLVDQGIALLGVGLLLLGASIGAGYLARRGLD